MNLLLVNASPRRERSLSRRLATAFVTQWLALRPRDVIVQRDVGIDHLEPHVRTCARYLGVATGDVHHVAIEYQEFGDERHRASLEGALDAAKALASRLASMRLPHTREGRSAVAGQ